MKFNNDFFITFNASIKNLTYSSKSVSNIRSLVLGTYIEFNVRIIYFVFQIDHVTNPSWQAQIKGSKLWTLEPVPECYNECRTIEAVVYPGEVSKFSFIHIYKYL